MNNMSISVLPKLKLYNTVPDYHLSSTNDKTVSIGQFKQRKNVVLFFFGSIDCEPCQEKLKEFKEYFNRLEHLTAVVFGISPEPVEQLKNLKSELELPFDLLSDTKLEMTNTYTHLREGGKEPVPSIFVIDRYNSLNSQWLAVEEKELPDVIYILRALHSIEIACPECGFFPGSTSL